MSEISLTEAASEIIAIEEAMPIHAPASVRLIDNFNDLSQAVWFRARESTHPSALQNLTDVVYDVPIRVLMKDGRRIPESRNMAPQDRYETLCEDAGRMVEVDDDMRTVIATNMSSDNYYHWMVQILPGIDWAARTNRHGKLRLGVRPLLQWQRESLALLGLEGLPVLELDAAKQYRFPRAQFNDFVRGELTYAVSRAVAITLRRLAARVPDDGAGQADAIFVSRTDSPTRPLRNEEKLIGLMERLGIRVIIPGTLSVADQVRAFRAAKLVVGLHGAGMSNIAFCQPGTIVYELLPRHYPNACFDFLAQSAQLNYWAEMFGENASDNPQAEPWSVELESVGRHVGEALARLSQS